MRMTRGMMSLADEGDAHRRDVSCGILYGTLRDAAYKLRTLAEREITTHKESGYWENEELPGKASASKGSNEI